MRNSSLLTLLFPALLLGSLGCPGNNSTEPDNNPRISTTPGSFSFTREANTGTLEISNAGGKELSWEISSKPDWIEASEESGTITTGKTEVTITASVSMNVGTYTGKIVISSNGGSKEVSVSLTIESRGLVGKWNLLTGSYNGSVLENLSGYYRFKEDNYYSAGISKDSNSGSISGRSYGYSGTTNGTINFDSPSQILLNGFTGGYTTGPDGVTHSWSTNISFSNSAFNQYGGTGLGWPPTESFRFEIAGDTLTISKSNGSTVLKYLGE